VALSMVIVPRTSDTIRLSNTRGTPTGIREILSSRDDGVAERFTLTYSSRIYLDPWKLRDRTVPSRYFPFYDSNTYAFKLAKRETPLHWIVLTLVFQTESPSTILRS